MIASRIVTLAILLLANVGLWLDRCFTGVEASSFDFVRLEAELRTRFPQLEARRFPPSAFLPRDYLYLVSTGDPTLRSVYVGYYPRRGFLADAPHDPLLCYPAQGWRLLGEPRPRETRTGARIHELNETTVQSPAGETRLVVYWSQGPKGSVRSDTGTWPELSTLLQRAGGSRRDYVWVRIELDPSCLEDRLDARHGAVAFLAATVAAAFE